jgi:hypothetical protein
VRRGVRVVDLKWHDAVAQAEHLFTAAERAAGWPETLSNAQVAALQRPPTTRSAFHRAIESACQGGELVHTATAVQAPLAAYAIKYNDGRPPPQRQYKTVTVLTVRAKDVATWLAAQEEAPSAHIAAWLKATAATPTAEPVQPAQPVHAPDDDNRALDAYNRFLTLGGAGLRGAKAAAAQEYADRWGKTQRAGYDAIGKGAEVARKLGAAPKKSPPAQSELSNVVSVKWGQAK